ncbi:MAG: 50S ribosomal protein L2 [Candidatus Kerfeldbacteria bacterium]|nr:50S ribosomal protein L2 [Candidatus Kerfeldbacteria bacterium]
MPITIYKPTTPGRRRTSTLAPHDITRAKPEKSLVRPRLQHAGRNAQGKITVRHRGGGHKRLYRPVDFVREKFDIPARVVTIEYDPNRNARIALLVYVDGEKRYIVSPHGLHVGDTVQSSRKRIDAALGNRMPLAFIPAGIPVHAVELIPGKGAEIARSAGSSVTLMTIEGPHALLRLPSSEIRKVPKDAQATVGQVSNPEAKEIRWGKAGRTRHRGFRPSVRGKAMNPVDHPHGGGEGRHPIGMTGPKTPWGKVALGRRTRGPNRRSSRLIVHRRGKER